MAQPYGVSPKPHLPFSRWAQVAELFLISSSASAVSPEWVVNLGEHADESRSTRPHRMREWLCRKGVLRPAMQGLAFKESVSLVTLDIVAPFLRPPCKSFLDYGADVSASE